MNENTKPKVNLIPASSLYSTTSNLYGFQGDYTNPDLRNLYDQNISQAYNKIAASASTSSRASINIPPGTVPDYASLKEGDIWNSDNTLSIFLNGKITKFQRVLSSNIANQSYTGASVNGPQTKFDISPVLLILNIFPVGMMFRYTAYGYLTTGSAAAYSLSMTTDFYKDGLYFVPGQAYDFSYTVSPVSGTFGVQGSLTNAYWKYESICTVYANGVSGQIQGQGKFEYYNGTSLVTTPFVSTTPNTVDLTHNQSTTVTAVWLSNGNTLYVTNYSIEILN